jgi:hypothetical protein
VRAELAGDLDAVGGAELAAHGVRHEMQRRLVHRAAVDAVQRARLGMAVGLEAALEQDHHARLAARGRAEQQEQAPANLGAGARRLEIILHALQGLVDAEELVGEELALGAHHVPHVLVARARDGARVSREYGFEELGESSGPVRGAMLLGELAQRTDEARALFVVLVHCSHRHVHVSLASVVGTALSLML